MSRFLSEGCQENRCDKCPDKVFGDECACECHLPRKRGCVNQLCDMSGNNHGGACTFNRVSGLSPSGIPFSLLNVPGPAPRTGTSPAIWSLVIRDMADRDASGVAKYGTRLQSDNGRDHLKDAYQEALDLAVYLRAELHRRDGR